MRYTKSDVKGMFNRLLKAMGKQQAPIMINDNTDTLHHIAGGWSLDYCSVYGGYVIEEEMDGGGINHPFATMRRTAREMYLSMLMTIQAIEDIRYRQELLNKYEVV